MAARISDLITALENIKANHGDLLCYAVEYHSDGLDTAIELDERIFVVETGEGAIGKEIKPNSFDVKIVRNTEPYLLIGGN